MRRFLLSTIAFAAFSIIGSSVIAAAGQAGGATAAAPAAKTVMANGMVSDVTPTQLIVKSKTTEWTFAIDGKTTVTAKGATHKTLALKADGKTPTLTDFVKKGDSVTVSYQDMGAMKHASSIRVTTQTK